MYSTTEACGSGGSNRNVQRISVYELGTGSVSGFLNNACVLKLDLLYLLSPFCCGSIRYDADERTTSNTDHISMEQKCEEARRWQYARSGWRGFVAACKSQGIVAGGMMSPKLLIHSRPMWKYWWRLIVGLLDINCKMIQPTKTPLSISTLTRSTSATGRELASYLRFISPCLLFVPAQRWHTTFRLVQPHEAWLPFGRGTIN